MGQREIVLICENCGKRYRVANWLPIGDQLWGIEVRAFCGEKCKKEWWENIPVFDMGGEEE